MGRVRCGGGRAKSAAAVELVEEKCVCAVVVVVGVTACRGVFGASGGGSEQQPQPRHPRGGSCTHSLDASCGDDDGCGGRGRSDTCAGAAVAPLPTNTELCAAYGELVVQGRDSCRCGGGAGRGVGENVLKDVSETGRDGADYAAGPAVDNKDDAT